MIFTGAYSQKTFFMGDSLSGQIKSIKFKTSKFNNPKNLDNSIDLNINYHEIFNDNMLYHFNFDKKGNMLLEEVSEKTKHRKFNERNKLVELTVYNLGNPKISNRTVYTYDGDENTKIEQYNYLFGYECLYENSLFTFDKNAALSELTINQFACDVISSDPKYTSKTHYTYDKNRNRIEENAFDIYGKLHAVKKYTYDAKNRLTKEYYMPTYNESDYQITYTYDNSNNIIQKIKNDKQDNLIKKETFKYGKNKALLEKETLLKNGVKNKFVYTYLENKLIEEQYFVNNILIYIKKCIFDKKGNATECNYFDEKDILKRQNQITIEYY